MTPQHLRNLASIVAPVAPDTPCGVVLERLDASPSLKPIPVVAGGRPIGLVAREGFLAGYDSGRAEVKWVPGASR